MRDLIRAVFVILEKVGNSKLILCYSQKCRQLFYGQFLFERGSQKRYYMHEERRGAKYGNVSSLNSRTGDLTFITLKTHGIKIIV